MIITISGKPGSGKTTVGKLLAKRLHYRFFSMGNIRRAMARERGMSLEAFNRLGERRDFTDREVDLWQTELGKKDDNIVVEGRTSFHFIPHSVKIFLDVSDRMGAKRIWNDKAAWRRFEGNFKILGDVELSLKRRIASDNRRYKKYYKLSILSKRSYDLVVDTSRHRPEQTLKVILKHLAKVSQNNTKGDKAGIKRHLSTVSTSKKFGKKVVKKVAKVSRKRTK